MKIIGLEEFKKLPEGTLFLKYQSCVFESLSSKGETWEHDFIYEDITSGIDCTGSGDCSDKLQKAEETGESLLMYFDARACDGCFEENQLFAVYDKRDIDMLIDKLNRCKKLAYT